MKIVHSFLLSFITFFLIYALFPLATFAETKEARSSAELVVPVIDEAPDNRAAVLADFLQQYNSPLAEHASFIVSEADKHNIDWRLLVAISGVESTFAKAYPQGTYNAWGWGIYGDNMHYFASWDDAIETITRELRTKYMDTWGAHDVYQIGSFYAASPTWAQRVTYFMDKIEEFENRSDILQVSISL